jgi:uncharacterized repeat protein (TIGR01451 family)
MPAPSAATPAANRADGQAGPGPGGEDDPTAKDPTAGRQESLVSVTWAGPSLVQVGQCAAYTLLVNNTSTLSLSKVQAHLRLPAGMTARETRPGAAAEAGVLTWQLGTLLPRQEKRLQMELVVDARGDVTPRAWVTFTGVSSAALRVRVREPKLALKVAAPGRVIAGDPVNVLLTVSNAGDSLAGAVKVRANLSEGLAHARGRAVDVEVGDLAAGESRTVQLSCLARAGGQQRCDVAAESGGCVRAQERVVVVVLVPRLEVELSGPALRYVDRKATYTLRVVNGGEVPASNVTLSEAIPPGFKLVAAAGGQHAPAARTVTWFFGELAPGQARQVQLELVAVKAGEHRHRATACSERGFKFEVARELVTRVEDFSALGLEIAHADDAIEVGKDMTYEVIVTNAGSKMETDIKLACAFPEKMEFKSAHGPTRYHREGNVLAFEPLPGLAPRGDVVYQIRVRALAPGDVRFKTMVTSTDLVEPVIKTEATRIYADRP